ncbi:MAG: DUF1573 domain-containing protein [Bacteroidaceae bacterium]|jgi:hypothetical protein|nr:DUF1573 domain-containing protein [Bacteroidaceae bacterium]
MKKIFTLFFALFCIGCANGFAQAEIKFEKTAHNFGTFKESEIQKTVFKFTNTGNEPLVIHQAITSCGCTVAKYTLTPVEPGKTGEVEVVYNGKGKLFGHFRKSITVRSNAKTPITRISIEGTMNEEEAKSE